MAIMGLNLSTTRTYESNLDPEKGLPGATRFVIGTIDSRCMAALRDDSVIHTSAQTTYITSRTQEFRVVQHGLRGFSGLRLTGGAEVMFKTVPVTVAGKNYDVADPEIVALLPPEVISELAGEIRRDNTVSEAEAGN